MHVVSTIGVTKVLSQMCAKHGWLPLLLCGVFKTNTDSGLALIRASKHATVKVRY